MPHVHSPIPHHRAQERGRRQKQKQQAEGGLRAAGYRSWGMEYGGLVRRERKQGPGTKTRRGVVAGKGGRPPQAGSGLGPAARKPPPEATRRRAGRSPAGPSFDFQSVRTCFAYVVCCNTKRGLPPPPRPRPLSPKRPRRGRTRRLAGPQAHPRGKWQRQRAKGKLTACY
jgi:hypothetical protein